MLGFLKLNQKQYSGLSPPIPAPAPSMMPRPLHAEFAFYVGQFARALPPVEATDPPLKGGRRTPQQKLQPFLTQDQHGVRRAVSPTPFSTERTAAPIWLGGFRLRETEWPV